MSDDFQDLYALLGVTFAATTDQISKAFRRISLSCHPDKLVSLPQAEKAAGEAKFKKFSAARDVLTDEASRSRYNVKWRAHQKRPNPKDDTPTRYEPRTYATSSKVAGQAQWTNWGKSFTNQFREPEEDAPAHDDHPQGADKADTDYDSDTSESCHRCDDDFGRISNAGEALDWFIKWANYKWKNEFPTHEECIIWFRDWKMQEKHAWKGTNAQWQAEKRRAENEFLYVLREVTKRRRCGNKGDEDDEDMGADQELPSMSTGQHEPPSATCKAPYHGFTQEKSVPRAQPSAGAWHSQQPNAQGENWQGDVEMDDAGVFDTEMTDV